MKGKSSHTQAQNMPGGASSISGVGNLGGTGLGGGFDGSDIFNRCWTSGSATGGENDSAASYEWWFMQSGCDQIGSRRIVNRRSSYGTKLFLYSSCSNGETSSLVITAF